MTQGTPRSESAEPEGNNHLPKHDDMEEQANQARTDIARAAEDIKTHEEAIKEWREQLPQTPTEATEGGVAPGAPGFDPSRWIDGSEKDADDDW